MGIVQKITPTVPLGVLRTGAGAQEGAATYILATVRHAFPPLLIGRIK